MKSKKWMIGPLALALALGCWGCSAQVRAAGATAPAGTALTGQQAEAIALEHAGFTADQVSRLRTEYEIDDGVARYEVQFRQGRWEYDYEISADSGQILSWDRDD